MDDLNDLFDFDDDLFADDFSFDDDLFGDDFGFDDAFETDKDHVVDGSFRYTPGIEWPFKKSALHVSDVQTQMYMKVAAQLLELGDWQNAVDVLEEIQAEHREVALSVFIESAVKRVPVQLDAGILFHLVNRLLPLFSNNVLFRFALIDVLKLPIEVELYSRNSFTDKVVDEAVEQTRSLISNEYILGWVETAIQLLQQEDFTDKYSDYVFAELLYALIGLDQQETAFASFQRDVPSASSNAALAWIKAIKQNINNDDKQLFAQAAEIIDQIQDTREKALLMADLGRAATLYDFTHAGKLFREALDLSFSLTENVTSSEASPSDDFDDFAFNDDDQDTVSNSFLQIVIWCLEAGYTEALTYLESWCDANVEEKPGWYQKLSISDAKSLLKPEQFIKVLTFADTTKHGSAKRWLFRNLDRTLPQSFSRTRGSLFSRTRRPSRRRAFSDDFDDFDFDDDLFGDDVVDDTPIQMPESVQKYRVTALSKLGFVRDTLAAICELSDKQSEKRKLATEVAEQWAKDGNYKGAISAAILTGFDSALGGDCWSKIAETAAEKDELLQLEEAIREHRALQAGAVMYLSTIAHLWQKHDGRLLLLWENYLPFIERLKNPAVTLEHLTFATIAAGLIDSDDRTRNVFRVALSEDEDEYGKWIAAVETLDLNSLTRPYAKSHDFLSQTSVEEFSRRIATSENSNFSDSLDSVFWLLFYFLAPNDLTARFSEFAYGCLKNAKNISDDTWGLWTYLIVLFHSLAYHHDNDKLIIAQYIGMIDEDEFLSIEVGQREALLYLGLVDLLRRYSVSDFADAPWENQSTFAVIDQIEDIDDRVFLLTFLASAFYLARNTSLVSESIERLLQLEDKQIVVEGLLRYATVLAFTGDVEDALETAKRAIDMWDDRIEKRAEPLEKSKRVLGKGSFFEDEYTRDHIDELSVKSVPVIQLTNLISSFLSRGELRRAEELLLQLLAFTRQEVITRLLSNYKAPILPEEVSDQQFETPGFKDFFGVVQQADHLRHKVVSGCIQLIRENPELFSSDDTLDYDLVAIIRLLQEQGLPDVGRLLVPYLKDDAVRLSTSQVFRTLEPSVNEQKGEKENTNSGSFASFQQVDFSSLPDAELEASIEIAEKLVSSSEQANSLRKIALVMARKQMPRAASVFDQAVRAARAAQTTSIPKPKGKTLQELAMRVTASNPDEVLEFVAGLSATQPDRRRDTLLSSVIVGLLNADRIADAEAIIDNVRIDPWRTDALVALVSKCLRNQLVMKAERWVDAAEGKISRFRLLLAFGIHASSIDDAKANRSLEEAKAIIPTFERDIHRAWATREYALALIKIEHSDAETALAQAIEKTSQLSDMLSRFYGFVDLLDDQLGWEALDPLKRDELILTARGIIFEAQHSQGYMNTVALGMPIWEIHANLTLAKVLAKHQKGDLARDLVVQAQEYESDSRYLPWDITEEFATVVEPDQLKRFYERLGTRSLSNVMTIVHDMAPALATISDDLPDQVYLDMLRLFRWVEYNPSDIAYLAGLYRPPSS